MVKSRSARRMILANGCSVATRGFRERVELAAAAGFDAIGVDLQAWRDAETELTAPGVRQLLADTGIGLDELEVVVGFAACGDGNGLAVPASTRAELAELFRIADVAGCRHVMAVGTVGATTPPGDAPERFSQLCARAAEHGLMVILESVPITDIPDVAAASALLAAAGAANATLCVDIWHHRRSGLGDDAVRALPEEQIGLVQLSDGPLRPGRADYVTETRHDRLLPGEGQFDVGEFWEAVTETGSRAPVAVEVLSDELGRLPPREAMRRLVDSVRPLLTD